MNYFNVLNITNEFVLMYTICGNFWASINIESVFVLGRLVQLIDF